MLISLCTQRAAPPSINIFTITDDAVILRELFHRLSDFLVATGSVDGFRVALKANREPALDLAGSNFSHFDTFVEQDGDVVRMTRLPEEIVFDPTSNRRTASLGTMLETASIGREVPN